jgi:ketose-bisphosphate aldolase
MYSRLFDGQSARLLAPSILEAIDALPTPAAFHLDHGAGIPQVQRALRYGASGIMIDASISGLDENIAVSKAVVELCDAVGVPVEAELGHVGTTADEVMGDFTDVDEAIRFVDETNVTALAIMVGTAHGRYKKTPQLNIDRIAQIKERVNASLVLHGGSGVPDNQVRKAIEAGIRKVNFGTDLCYAFINSVDTVSREIFAIDKFMMEPIESIKRFAISKIELLGAGGNV